jgi:predicted RNA-binding protein associated with RNAse of E/G family
MDGTVKIIASGEWNQTPEMRDYRSEWLSDLLVERATCSDGAQKHQLGQVTIGGPGFVWFRFWLAEGEYILEKYFDPDGQALGTYARIGMAVPHKGRGFSALNLLLGLWITDEGHVTVLNELEFDAAVADGELSPVEAEHAEQQIREVTMAIASGRFPPPIVRNLSIAAIGDHS